MQKNWTRRSVVTALGATAAGAALSPLAAAADPTDPADPTASGQRPPLTERRFHSEAVEEYIARTRRQVKDPALAALFANCYPNTLDTTVTFSTFEGKPDTTVLTGDIPAMWLRDSSAQVWPYLPLAKQDQQLRALLEGVIRRQARCILIDPYANAFRSDLNAPPLSWSLHDKTEMKQGVAERKWEVDSLCYPLRLAHGYWQHTGDTAPFDAQWHKAVTSIVATFRAQQRKHGPSPYTFERLAETSTDTLSNSGRGNPVQPNGLVASSFRPSDDACIFPFLVPSNLFAVTSLRQLAKMASKILADTTLAHDATALADEVAQALQQHAVATTPQGTIWAYEVDGFGSQLLMDDANVPSLLGLPYLDSSPDPALYQRTRAFCWSERNPWFFRGTAGEGIGGPHEGDDMIWPMSQMIYALTSNSPREIQHALAMLKLASANTGFMHESYFKDDPAKFTRPWFAWANTLFGELIGRVVSDHPNLA